MNPLRLAVYSFTAASFLASVTSCTSDRNPFDIQVQTQTSTAKIRLQLDVAATRAGEDLSTAEERQVSKVSIYVFDGADKLDIVKTNIDISLDTPVEIDVKPGKTTVYAISSKSVITTSEEMTMVEFENALLNSKLDATTNHVKNGTEFVMVGKSKAQQVFKTVSASDVPVSNIFNIELVRLVAKTQVKLGAIDTDAFGFTCDPAYSNFWVSQTCDKMRIQPNGVDVIESYVTHNTGTFEGYTIQPNANETQVVTGDFTANGCDYLSENIVQSPVAGNTSFVGLALRITPKFVYTYSSYGGLTATIPSGNPIHTFYAVALVDESNGLEDYAFDPEKKSVVTFTDKKEADKYCEALNGEEASAITVSEVDGPMKASVTEATEHQVRKFKTVTFDSPYAYYRINIKDEEGNLKVERNKFYKITVNSIKNLGCHDKALLRPTNPNVGTDIATSSAMIEAVFTVAPWDNQDQSVDL